MARWWTALAPWRPRIRLLVFSLVGASLAVALAGRVSAVIGPFDATVSARPSLTGETTVHLAPLGTITLDTHDWPLALDLRADQIGLDEAEQIAQDPTTIDDLGDDVANDIRDSLRRLALQAVLAAVVGGILGGLAARLSLRSGLAGAAVAVVLVVTIAGGTAARFDANAVAEPRYTGVLTVAPAAVGDIETIIDRYGEYRAQLSDLVSNVVTLYLAAETLPSFRVRDDTIKLLHVSDIHLNPSAFDLMDQVTEQFDVDAIVDTGDMTDWGTDPETRLVSEIGRLDVTYVYVRGNHDSRRIQRAIAEQPNAIVLDGEAETVAGLRMWGIGDPRFTPDKDQPVGRDAEREAAEEFASDVAERLAESEPPPVDLVLIHDQRAAADLADEVPLVLAGHTHEAEESRLGDETVLMVEGSTGGAGLRGLQGESPEPLTATLLYFDPEDNRLVAYDRIILKGFGETGATIERHLVDPGQLAGSEDENDENDEGDEGDGAGVP
jgi:predicted phosphodiesterase